MPAVCLDIETICPEEHRKAIEEMAGDRDPDAFGALLPPLARVVCVGLAGLNGGDEIGKEVALYDRTLFPGVPSVPGAEALEGEKGILVRLAQILTKVDRIVTFNGTSFDVPTLLLRSMAHGIQCPTLLKAHQEYRYKPDLNYDLREQFTSFGRFRDGSLRAFCLGLGLPDPKLEGAGAHVAELVKLGDAAGLVRYCQGDVRAAGGLYKAWRVYLRKPELMTA